MLGTDRLITVSGLILASLSTLLLIAACPAQAQTETVLYNFTGGSDGRNPQSTLTPDGGGNYYGATPGTVFELSPNPDGGWNQNVVFNFPGGVDGEDQSGPLMFDGAGNLYGTLLNGGAYGYGTVFELIPMAGSWTEIVLYNFTGGTDGLFPRNGVIMDATGNLYGSNGGANGIAGVVFELSPSGGDWIEQTIYVGDSNITGTLTMDANGNLFGTTADTAFKLSPNGEGGWKPAVIHTFKGNDASATGTLVFDPQGNLYGTTVIGGPEGCGTVYKLSPGKNAKWTMKGLHFFNFKNGSGPTGVLVDAAGNIYGTTSSGGKYGDQAGVVFELMPQGGTGKYKGKVLWNFNFKDGSTPSGSLILDSSGNLYGATPFGGSSGYGVVFEVTP